MIQYRKRFEQFYLTALPALITLCLAIFFLSAKHVSGLEQFMPLLPIIPVFYWGITQPRDMPTLFLFMLGLVIDASSGLPLGFTALTYLFFLLLVHTQRKYIHKEAFIIKWGFFGGLLAITYLFDWLILSLIFSSAVPIGAATIQWFLTVCCYPIFHKLFDNVHEYTVARRWQILHGH